MQNSPHGSTSSRHLSLVSFRNRPQDLPAVLGLILALAGMIGPAVASEPAGEVPASYLTPAGDLELRSAAPSPAGALVELGREESLDLLEAASLRLLPGADRLKIHVGDSGSAAIPSKVHVPDPGPGGRGEPLTAGPSRVHVPAPSPGSRGDGDDPEPGEPGESSTAAVSKVHLRPLPPIAGGPGRRAEHLGLRSRLAQLRRQAAAQRDGRQHRSGQAARPLERQPLLDHRLADLSRRQSGGHGALGELPGAGRFLDRRRGSNGTEEWVAELPYALSANDGSILWESQDEITAGAYDGVVLAQDGDLVIGSFQTLTRIDAVTGQTVWRSSRQCSVSGSCGAVMGPGQEVYVADVTAGGHRLVRYGAATGQRLYESEVMPGFTLQDVPFVGPDGTVYLARTQSNPLVDFLYAFDDLGDGFAQRWSVPSAWLTVSVHAVPGDGTLYMVAPGNELLRLDAVSGATLASAGVLEGLFSVRMAVDAVGKLYVSDGVTSLETSATLYGFNPDLTLRWSEKIPRINIGGPNLGADGFLTVAGIGDDLWAYKNARSAPACP